MRASPTTLSQPTISRMDTVVRVMASQRSAEINEVLHRPQSQPTRAEAMQRGSLKVEPYSHRARVLLLFPVHSVGGRWGTPPATPVLSTSGHEVGSSSALPLPPGENLSREVPSIRPRVPLPHQLRVHLQPPNKDITTRRSQRSSSNGLSSSALT